MHSNLPGWHWCYNMQRHAGTAQTIGIIPARNIPIKTITSLHVLKQGKEDKQQRNKAALGG